MSAIKQCWDGLMQSCMEWDELLTKGLSLTFSRYSMVQFPKSLNWHTYYKQISINIMNLIISYNTRARVRASYIIIGHTSEKLEFHIVETLHNIFSEQVLSHQIPLYMNTPLMLSTRGLAACNPLCSQACGVSLAIPGSREICAYWGPRIQRSLVFSGCGSGSKKSNTLREGAWHESWNVALWLPLRL